MFRFLADMKSRYCGLRCPCDCIYDCMICIHSGAYPASSLAAEVRPLRCPILALTEVCSALLDRIARHAGNKDRKAIKTAQSARAPS